MKATDELGAMAREIRKLNSKFLKAVRTSLDTAIEIGGILVKAKAKVGHGNWAEWLKKNVDFSERTAEDYANFFRNRGALKSAKVANLSEARDLVRQLMSPPQVLQISTAPNPSPVTYGLVSHNPQPETVLRGFVVEKSREPEPAAKKMSAEDLLVNITHHADELYSIVRDGSGDWDHIRERLLPHIEILRTLARLHFNSDNGTYTDRGLP